MSLSCEEVRELAAGYVLDALEPAERELVRDHLQTCAAAHGEFQELGEVVPYLAETIEPVEPPASLRQRIMAAAATDVARAEEAARRPAGTAARPWPLRLARSERSPRERHRSAPLAWLSGAAAAVLIIVLAGSALVLQNELQTVRQYEQGIAAVLDLAAEEGSEVALLSGEQGAGPHGLAAIGRDGRVVMAMRDLPATSGEEVYEAWVIAGDSAPVPIGGFQVGARGTGTLVTGISDRAAGVILAITREPSPGATTPTAPIIASGTASDPSS